MSATTNITSRISNKLNTVRHEPHAMLVAQLTSSNGGLVVSNDLISRLKAQDNQFSLAKKIQLVEQEILQNGAPNTDQLLNEIGTLLSFVASHEREIQNAQEGRGLDECAFLRRNARIEKRVGEAVEFLTRPHVQPEKKETVLSIGGTEVKKTTIMLNNHMSTPQDQRNAQKAQMNARKNLVKLLDQEVDRLEEAGKDSSIPRRALKRLQSENPHLFETEQVEVITPHEFVNRQSNARTKLITIIVKLIEEHESKDRLTIASILVKKNKMTDREVDILMTYLDKDLQAEIHENGLMDLSDNEMNKFLAVSGREISMKMMHEDLAIGPPSESDLKKLLR